MLLDALEKPLKINQYVVKLENDYPHSKTLFQIRKITEIVEEGVYLDNSNRVTRKLKSLIGLPYKKKELPSWMLK